MDLVELSRRADLLELWRQVPGLPRKWQDSESHGQAVLSARDHWPDSFRDQVRDVLNPHRELRQLVPADVLWFLCCCNPMWSPQEVLHKAGIRCYFDTGIGHDEDSVQRLIDKTQPRAIINTSFAIAAEIIKVLARRHPHINFVTVCHSSQSFLVSRRTDLRDQNAFMRLAIESPNCWYATPDERRLPWQLIPCERLIWMPNVVTLQPSRQRPTPSDLFRVSIVGRRDVIKNFPNQTIAAAIVNRNFPVPVRLVLCSPRGARPDLRDMAELGGLGVDELPWQDEWCDYIPLLDKSVDIGLQASFSESFNYVAVDHLTLGIPVIGSPSIRYLPREWQAEPDDPASIARVLVGHCQEWEVRSVEARQIAADLAATNKSAITRTVQMLLD